MTNEQKQAAWREYAKSVEVYGILPKGVSRETFLAGLNHGLAYNEGERGELASFHKVYERLSDYILGTDNTQFAELNDGIDVLYSKLRKEMDRHEEEFMTMDCRDIAR